MWVVIPKNSELRKKRKLTWFYGIDPVELKDGTFVLPERVIADIEKFDIKFKKVKIGDKDKEVDKELKKFEKKDKVNFKSWELESK